MSDWTPTVEGPIAELVDRWIVDYFSRILWRQFESNGTIVVGDWVESFVLDQQRVQVSETRLGEDHLDQLEAQSRLLIQFMCRMSSCAKGIVVACGGSEEDPTVMEEAIDLMDQIVKVNNHGLPYYELLRIRVSIRQQAVYVCCRDGNFDLAAKVFFRQWKSWNTNEEMEARKNIAKVLDSKNHVHHLLKSLPFETTITDCKIFLRKIFKKMTTPFLVTAAKRVWDQMNNANATKKKDADVTVTRVKREHLFYEIDDSEPEQTDKDATDLLVKEVCSLNENVPNSSSGLQILPGRNCPAVNGGAETMLTMLPTADKKQTYPLLLWTNSVSPEMLSSSVGSSNVIRLNDGSSNVIRLNDGSSNVIRLNDGSSNVLRLNDIQHAISREYVQQPHKEIGTAEPRMLLGIGSNQFPVQENIYFNTVPVVSSQVFSAGSLIQDSGNIIESYHGKGGWKVHSPTISNDNAVHVGPVITKVESTRIPEIKSELAQNSKQKPYYDLTLTSECVSSSRSVGRPPSSKTTLSEKLKKSRLMGKKFRGSSRSSSVQADTSLGGSRGGSLIYEQQTARITRNTSKFSPVGRRSCAVPEKLPVVRLDKISQNFKKVPELGSPGLNLRNKSDIHAVTTKTGNRSFPNKSSQITDSKSKIDKSTSGISKTETLRKQLPLKTPPPASKIVRKLRNGKNVGSVSTEPKQNVSSVDRTSKASPKQSWGKNGNEALYKAVQKHGRRWVYLSQNVFRNRAPRDIACKWQALKKHMEALEDQFGPLTKEW